MARNLTYEIASELGKKGGAKRKGTKNKTTIEREKILEEIKNIGASRAKTLLNIQTLLAVGTISVFRQEVDTNGKRSTPELVKDDRSIIRALDYAFGDGEDPSNKYEFFFVQKNKPDNTAINSILDRTFGKATENKVVSFADDIDEEAQEIALGAVKRALEQRKKNPVGIPIPKGALDQIKLN